MAIRWDDLDGQDGELDMFAAWMAGYDPGPTLAERLTAWRPAWQAKAACRGLATNLWYPGPGDPATEARAVCAGCAVSEPCRQLAAANHEGHGIWGGATRGRGRASGPTISAAGDHGLITDAAGTGRTAAER